MDVSNDARRDLGSISARVTGVASGGVDDTGRLHLILDAAILVQVPIRRVLVVADGRDRRDHQLPGTTHLGAVGANVEVLPGETGIFLMQADRVLDRARDAEQVRNHRVEIMDGAEAVAAKLERIGHPAKSDLTAVEHVLPIVAPFR